MLPSWITDPLWDQFHALLPERIDQQRRRARRLLRPTGPLFWSLLLYRLAAGPCTYRRRAAGGLMASVVASLGGVR